MYALQKGKEKQKRKKWRQRENQQTEFLRIFLKGAKYRNNKTKSRNIDTKMELIKYYQQLVEENEQTTKLIKNEYHQKT